MKIIVHILADLNGKIAGPFFSSPQTRGALAAYARIREELDCHGIVYGRTTMEEGFSDGLFQGPAQPPVRVFEDYQAPARAETFIISLDPQGTLFFKDGTASRKKRAPAHTIQVLTGQVSQAYLDQLKAHQVSWIQAGQERLDLELAVKKLEEQFGIQRLLVAGGGICDWSFVKTGLADQLSIVLAPVAAADKDAPSIFEPLSPPDGQTVGFALRQVRVMDGDSVWLLYEKRPAESAR